MNNGFPAAVPEIPVTNMNVALDYYKDKLGFSIDWGSDSSVLIKASLTRVLRSTGIRLP